MRYEYESLVKAPRAIDSTVHLPVLARRQVRDWAQAGYPFEACGLLIGHQSPGDVWVERVTRARNLNRERARDRYELDPKDFLGADRAAEKAGLEVIGVWHSHPDHPARPSPTDHANAWPGWSYLIVAVTDGKVTDIRSWRLEKERFCEELLADWQPCA